MVRLGAFAPVRLVLYYSELLVSCVSWKAMRLLVVFEKIADET